MVYPLTVDHGGKVASSLARIGFSQKHFEIINGNCVLQTIENDECATTCTGLMFE